jgi:hypothetical protein
MSILAIAGIIFAVGFLCGIVFSFKFLRGLFQYFTK